MIAKFLIATLFFVNPLSFLVDKSAPSNFTAMSEVEKESSWTNFLLSSVLQFSNPNFFPIRDFGVSDPDIQAEAIVVCAKNCQSSFGSILYKKEADVVMPIASLTKMMTAMVVVEEMDLGDKVLVSQEALDKGYGEQEGIFVGADLFVRDLLDALLMESSNDAAFILAEHFETVHPGKNFVEEMNVRAKEIGLSKTRFVEPSGYDEGNVSTALEVAILAEHDLKYPLIGEIMRTKEKQFSTYTFKNTNKLLWQYPEIIGGKTGYTDNAKECLVEVLEREGPGHFITVVLGSQDRFVQTQKLIEWVDKAYRF